VPGQEQANAASLTGEGAAVVGVGVDEVIQQVLALVDSPEALHALRVNARRIYLPAAETIADAIADALAE